MGLLLIFNVLVNITCNSILLTLPDTLLYTQILRLTYFYGAAMAATKIYAGCTISLQENYFDMLLYAMMIEILVSLNMQAINTNLLLKISICPFFSCRESLMRIECLT